MIQCALIVAVKLGHCLVATVGSVKKTIIDPRQSLEICL